MPQELTNEIVGRGVGIEAVTYHTHDGVNSPKLTLNDIYVTWLLPGDTAQTANHWNSFWIAPIACTVIEINFLSATHATNSCILQVEKLTGTQVPTGGVTLLAANLEMRDTSDSTVTPLTLTATASSLTLAKGNRISWVQGGSLAGLTNPMISITLRTGA